MNEQELREKMTEAMGQCYSQELSACPAHPIFQPQKAINLILSLIKQANYVRLADDQSLPEYPELTYDSFQCAFEGGQQRMLGKGWRKVDL